MTDTRKGAPTRQRRRQGDRQVGGTSKRSTSMLPCRPDTPVPKRARLHSVPPDATAGQVTYLRAIAQREALRVNDWPTYGSVQWLQLPSDDPRTYVATLEAAELHRMHVERLHTEAHDQAVNVLQTAAEVRAARTGTSRTSKPHTLTATPDWPPIAIPGQPGEYLTYQEASE